MKVAVFGVGYVGFTSCCCIASEGHSVVGVDVDPEKVRQINEGEVPFQEPELDQLLSKAQASKSLAATTDARSALVDTNIAIVCVGTPSLADGSHNMKYITNVTAIIAKALSQNGVSPSKRLSVVYRSTVKPGTLRGMISSIFQQQLGSRWDQYVQLVFNPEFLREGKAVFDYFNPARIVIGTLTGESADDVLALYKNIDAPVLTTTYEEAEFIKFVDNTWHATKVAFANEIGRIGRSLALDPSVVHDLFAADHKLNLSAYYTRPGGPFGGSCLPKDSRAMLHMANANGISTPVIESLLFSNEEHLEFLVQEITKKAEKPSEILLNGITFKQNTDDLRESPYLRIAKRIVDAGHKLRIFDPNITLSRLHGANYSELVSFLPDFEDLMITEKELRNHKWHLIVNANSEIELVNGQDVAKFNIFEFRW